MPKADLQSLVTRLQQDFPKARFQKADDSRWSPEEQTVYYKENASHSDWSLLHETGHMVCDHQTYESDIDLLQMEVAAWERAKQLAATCGLHIDQEYIEKCLDSYRDWLHKRSRCPECAQAGVERAAGSYRCINCGFAWQVSPDRFCRVYRRHTKLPTS
jgi:hypothetical protein